MSLSIEIPPRFKQAYQALENLSFQDRYTGAFIFGSLARGDTNDKSDLDAKVIVDTDNSCDQVNHPIINGVKLDISFLSFRQLRKQTSEEIKKRQRIPFIAESIIVFDKTGQLHRLQERAQKVKPTPIHEDKQQWLQFMVYHADDKAKRTIDTDPATSLLAMGINISEILQYHYQLNQRWWVSNKRLLPDLRTWDPDLAQKVEDFVSIADAKQKYEYWSQILDHVTKPLGGRQPISENNCNCSVCVEDLDNLTRNR